MQLAVVILYFVGMFKQPRRTLIASSSTTNPEA
jgi:hypothetical protein